MHETGLPSLDKELSRFFSFLGETLSQDPDHLSYNMEKLLLVPGSDVQMACIRMDRW